MAIFQGENPAIVYDYRDGIKRPYIQINETHQVVNGKVKLSEIPNWENRVMVKDENDNPLAEIHEGVPSLNQYLVDYNLGIVSLNSARNGQGLEFDYVGIGVSYINTSMIWTQLNLDNKTVVETLEDIITRLKNTDTGQFDSRLVQVEVGQGNLGNLITDNKEDTVSAINEVKSELNTIHSGELTMGNYKWEQDGNGDLVLKYIP